MHAWPAPGRLRKPRIKLIDTPAVDHCISRIVGGQFLLDAPANEQLRLMLRQQAESCGLALITYTILSNHFHALARMPEPAEISDVKLRRRAEYRPRLFVVAGSARQPGGGDPRP